MQSSDNIGIFNVNSYLLFMRLFWHHALPYASSNNLNVCRCLGAVLSGKRFLASVWKHVAHQTIWVTASVVALLTGKEFFSSVRGLVILEMTSTIARIVALLTSEIPFSCTNGCASWGFEVLLHCEQPKGFARGWLSMCLLRFPAVVQAKLHCVQLKDISPECIWLWIWGEKLSCRRSYTVCEQITSLLNGRASVFWGHHLLYMSSCIVCKHRVSLPSVWACVSWGSQPMCRRSCTVCKQQASLHCELDRPQSFFYFVPQEISQQSRIGQLQLGW